MARGEPACGLVSTFLVTVGDADDAVGLGLARRPGLGGFLVAHARQHSPAAADRKVIITGCILRGDPHPGAALPISLVPDPNIDPIALARELGVLDFAVMKLVCRGGAVHSVTTGPFGIRRPGAGLITPSLRPWAIVQD